MAKSEKKTNVMRILDQEKIPYIEHTYDVSDGVIDGVSVAKKCNQNVEQVFKTLVTKGNDGNIYVFVIPVAEELDLKACAKAVGAKSVEMVHVKDLLGLTGYIRGGCSPIGMKKKFRTVFDETVLILDSVMVSGGKQGMQVEMKPEDILKVTGATTFALTR